MLESKVEVSQEVKKRVSNSQLGIFINLVEQDTPIEEFTNLNSLAKHISIEFDVDCRAQDIEKYMNLDVFVEDNFEVESNKIEYYGI